MDNLEQFSLRILLESDESFGDYVRQRAGEVGLDVEVRVVGFPSPDIRGVFINGPDPDGILNLAETIVGEFNNMREELPPEKRGYIRKAGTTIQYSMSGVTFINLFVPSFKPLDIRDVLAHNMAEDLDKIDLTLFKERFKETIERLSSQQPPAKAGGLPSGD